MKPTHSVQGSLSAFLPPPRAARPRLFVPAFPWMCLGTFLLAVPSVRAQARLAGESRGHGIQANLRLASLLDVNVDPAGQAEGTAPPAYSDAESGVPLNVDLGVPLVVDLLSAGGVIESSASSDITGAAGASVTTATASVADLDLALAQVLGLLGAPPLLELDLGAVHSVSTVTTNAAGVPVPSGSAGVAGLTLKVLNQPVTLSVGENPAPNTTVDLALSGLAGATLVFNEETVTTVPGRVSVARNALSIKLNAVTVGTLGLLTGTINIGHSEALVRVDSDGDGAFDDTDSDDDGDGIPDADEGNGAVDTDGDGIPDSADPDSDNDGIPDAVETGADTDGDGIPNQRDLDSDNDGIRDAVETAADTDGDGAGDFRDLDSDNDGINDVREGGGADADGNGFQDGTADADDDGLTDTADPDQGGAALPLPDTDGDLVPDVRDVDSDNDTLSDAVENGSPGADANDDGLLDGPDTDGDGIVNSADGSPLFGDAGDPAPRNTDGADRPNYADTDSDNSGSPDIAGAGHGGLDTNRDGAVDNASPDPDGDGIAQPVDDKPAAYGGLENPYQSPGDWLAEHFTPAELGDPAVCGWDADPDHDGADNLQEYAGGTLPKDPASVVRPDTTLVPGSGDGAVLEIGTTKSPTAQVFVGVEVSTGLTAWTPDPALVEITEETASVLKARTKGASTAQPRQFARLRYTLP